MSDNIRVYEIAAEAGASATEVIEKAKDIGITNLKSPQTAVSFEDAEEIANYIVTGKSAKLIKVSLSKLAFELNIDKSIVLKEAKKLNFKVSNKRDMLSKEQYEKLKHILNEKIISSQSKSSITINNLSTIIEESHNDILNVINDLEINIDNNKIKYEDANKVLNYFKLNENEIVKPEKVHEERKVFSSKKSNYSFNHKNILLKGVPGTGKSRAIDNIIKNNLEIEEKEHILRINIHSSSSNSDLMHGIGINTTDGNIEYKEKQGLILNFIEEATFNPNIPFALILEEIQENSLNELIGDLIYLIEDSKRTKIKNPNNKKYSYEELINYIEETHTNLEFIKIPRLVSTKKQDKKMILPDNLYIFCTSNYRDDKKIIEDNLLRRFDVIEIYPKYKDTIKEDFKNLEVSKFLENLNKSIIKVFNENGEIHPDRFMIGHSNWLNVKDSKTFDRAFLKVITEFKDIKDIHFDDFEEIIKDLKFPFRENSKYLNYQEWISDLQSSCYDFFK